MTAVPTIYQAINAVMKDVRSVAKDGWNDAPNAKYAFRGVDHVIDAVGPALREHGVIVVPKVLDWQYGTVIVGHKQTQMSHARLTVQFNWYGPAGDTFPEPAVVAAEAFDSGDKATSKAHSVAYRTNLIETLSLPTNEPDPDSDAYERSNKPVATFDDSAEAARQELLTLLAETDREPGEAAEKFAADGHGNIGQSNNTEAIKKLTEHFRKLAGRS